MKPESMNRVELEVQKWREHEDKFRKLFSFDTSTNKGLCRQKLRDYERISARFRNSKDPAERLSLVALKQERRHLEKLAYRNKFIRLFRRMIVLPVKQQLFYAQQRKQVKNNNLKVGEILEKAGMKSQQKKVAQHVQNEDQVFSVHTHQFVNRKELLDNNLSFERNSLGDYELISQQVGLHNNEELGVGRKHKFELPNGYIVSPKQNYNLLNGRSIQIDDKWVQLDLNDKDLNGNYKVKEIYHVEGFDIRKIIKDLKFKDYRTDSQIDDLAKLLCQGERVSVMSNRKQYEIEANPQFRTIDIFDSNELKITKTDMLSRRNSVTQSEKIKVATAPDKRVKVNGIKN